MDSRKNDSIHNNVIMYSNKMGSQIFFDRVGSGNVNTSSVPNFDKYCFLHTNCNHDLANCCNFQSMTYDDRVQLVKEARLYFRYFGALSVIVRLILIIVNAVVANIILFCLMKIIEKKVHQIEVQTML